MSHDLGLGGPYEVERDPEALHPGPCFDGVYGCHRCWNAENDGRGTIARCESCRAEEVFTRIRQAIDEPSLYAACETCARDADAAAQQELIESGYYDYYDGDDDD